MQTTLQSIPVLGTGKLGNEIPTSLSKHPQHTTKLTILLRPNPSPSKTTIRDAKMNPLGSETLPGDLATNTETQLATTFAPFHTVITCTGMALPPGTQLKTAKAALRTGVKRFFSWQFRH
ncbi:hypothetical protein MBLNU230_g7681t1 [Neophaeotheca triangularis]